MTTKTFFILIAYLILIGLVSDVYRAVKDQTEVLKSIDSSLESIKSNTDR